MPPQLIGILEDTLNPPPPAVWLIRISEVFEENIAEIIAGLDAKPVKRLGRGFHLIRLRTPAAIRHSPAAKFVRWNLPVQHSWPCNPKETPGFIEKAAQALARKFHDEMPQTVVMGPLDPGAADRYYRALASNLRGRTLQLFPAEAAAIRNAEDQNPRAKTLFCLIGEEGLFCGIQSPADSGGFHPGGTKFIRQSGPDTISRAGAKIAEALHFLRLLRPLPPAGNHWLELGASPGGMTSELLKRGYRVTAVDRAPLDPRLDQSPGLRAIIADVASFQPASGVAYEAILSDMNGDAMDSIGHVIRLVPFLTKTGLIIFTLKLPGVSGFNEANELLASVSSRAEAAGLRVFGKTHLTYNRREFTLFLEHADSPSAAPNGL